jgi:guanosine-3',5'-bis(diphosphate) 3'-pyrophosphohydrolase
MRAIIEGIMSEAQLLIDRTASYLPANQIELIEQAWQFASECHQDQKRMSGESYIVHPLKTALFLADLRLDNHTITAALLHDVVEDCGIPLEEIDKRFGTEVSKLVDGVTKLTRLNSRLPSSSSNPVDRSGDADGLYAESLRKMLVAMAEDIRVVLIKLADRLHNMQTLGALPPEKRKRIAQETLDIYCPLAHRLGIWDIKWKLEDLAFSHLNEKEYRIISRMLDSKRAEREAYVEQVCTMLSKELNKDKITSDVDGRPKGIYSIYRKKKKYAEQGKDLNEIYDLYALRVLVDSQEACYQALGTTHRLWHPIHGQFDDYIANPKENMYQALHTTVICLGGRPLEVQIKTNEMHQVAEYGVSAHWRYKEGKTADLRFEEKMTWLRQMLEWQREVVGTAEFIETVQQDLFHDQVFVYTPKGGIVELSSGSTPVDFAYKIHTELGHHCSGGKVNGRLVSLDTPLQNGDTVEILVSKRRGPSLDWLNPNLGYMRSASARQKVKQWFQRQRRSTSIHRGQQLLRKELRRLGLDLGDSDILALVKFDNMDDFLTNLGSGAITENQVAYRLSTGRQEPGPTDFQAKEGITLSSPSSGIFVMGVGNLLVRIARCCNPIPGDQILGFITRTRGVTVHKVKCSSIKNEDEPERIVKVAWGETREFYPVRLRVEAYDRLGLLRDISVQVSQEGVNIASVTTDEQSDGTVKIDLTLHTTGLDQLWKVFAKLEGVRGVNAAFRVDNPLTPPVNA